MGIFPVLFYFTMLFFCERIHGEGDSMKIEIAMPNVHPREDDSYFCTAMKLPEGDSYIVGYEPIAHKETVHHMLLFGCDAPGHHQTSWNCGVMGAGACNGFESILFGWAKDAPSLKLPKDIGFKVGGKTQTKYLVVQIHYVHKLKDGETDSSGLTVHMKSKKQPNLASIYLLYVNSANILPHAKGIHVDIACEYNGDDDIHAFAFRTHSHDLGRVITGYRVRNNTWKLLGKGDPHAPQAFYPMKNLYTIKKGDILAARCTYDTFNTDRSEVTNIGSTSGDEMCNFYMMYYRDARSAGDVPDGCGDQYTLQHLFPSFPKDSDVALPPSGHHHHHHHHHPQHTTNEVGPEGTKNVINSKHRASVHNPDAAVTETNNHEGLGDNVIPGDVVIPESREENNFSPTTEAWAQDGRQISNSVTDNAEPTAGHNLTDGVGGETSREKPIWDATDTTLLEKMTTRSPATESPELHGSERPSHVTPDVNTSTSISEQTTPLSPVTVIPTTRHQESRTERSTAEPELKSAHDETASPGGGNIAKGQHGLNIVPSQNNDVVDNVSVVVVDWPSKSVAGKLGQVTGLAVDSAGRVLVFHRAGRTWDLDTFNDDNTFRYPKTRGVIRDTTIFMLDAKSGKLLKEWGSRMFYLPHGLTVDHEDNVWVTDVGAHQVTKFPREKTKPSLTLGRHLIPGAGEKHFCKPTDVAVEKSGVFYVADGYCNGRIMKFSRKGVLLNQWGKPSVHSTALHPPNPGTFDIPHSLTLNEKRGMLYVADRENGRIQCFDTDGEFHKQISSPMFGGRVFAVDYNDQDDILYAVNGPGNAKVSGFTIDPTTGKVLAAWSPHNKGFSQPHAVISSGVDIYVAEIDPNKVWKLETQRKVDSKELNFVRNINNAVVNNPLAAKPGDDGGSADHSKSETKPSNRPAVVILAILSVPAAILLLVGLVSKIRGRGKKLHKYDMMDETLTNHTTSTNLCASTNCCRKPYNNMEELYLMDSDSDIEMFPDVRIDKK